MSIKFPWSVLSTPLQQKTKGKTKKSQKSEVRGAEFPGSWPWLLILPLSFNFYLPSQQRTGVVWSAEENTNQWTGITTRLQVGVAYCVIDLPAVKSAADLGDRVKVVFLPRL